MKRSPAWRRTVIGTLLVAMLLLTAPLWFMAALQLERGAE